MITHPLTNRSVPSSLNKTIELLSDLHDALEENAYAEEAEVVSKHLEQLKSPQLESRIMVDGINPVMEELSRCFSNDTSPK